MAGNDTSYYVFGDQYQRVLVGDREETRATHEGSEDGCDWKDGPFAEMEGAMAAGRAWIADEEPAAAHDDLGIGRIAWSEFVVMEVGEDGSCSSVGGGSNLTTTLSAAFERARHGYYRWLDYETDGYGTVTEALRGEAGAAR